MLIAYARGSMELCSSTFYLVLRLKIKLQHLIFIKRYTLDKY